MDSLIHPLSKLNLATVVLDVILHGLVEQEPTETVVRFMRYNDPWIKELTESKGKKRAQH
jgi:hypothetical protein